MLECITVSINYSDYLAVVVNHNKKFLNRWIIATTSNDANTINLCHQHGLEYVFCDDVIQKNGAIFNKGAIINKAFSMLEKKDWILHLDSDMMLPTNFYQISGNTHIFDKTCLYGMHRWQIPNKQSAINYINGVTGYPEGSQRLFDDCAIGFFQMVHNSSLKQFGNQFYSEKFDTAAHSDNEFRDQYRKLGKDRYIEHFDTFHLGPTGVNWTGRKSSTF